MARFWLILRRIGNFCQSRFIANGFWANRFFFLYPIAINPLAEPIWVLIWKLNFSVLDYPKGKFFFDIIPFLLEPMRKFGSESQQSDFPHYHWMQWWCRFDSPTRFRTLIKRAIPCGWTQSSLSLSCHSSIGTDIIHGEGVTSMMWLLYWTNLLGSLGLYPIHEQAFQTYQVYYCESD